MLSKNSTRNSNNSKSITHTGLKSSNKLNADIENSFHININEINNNANNDTHNTNNLNKMSVNKNNFFNDLPINDFSTDLGNKKSFDLNEIPQYKAKDYIISQHGTSLVSENRTILKKMKFEEKENSMREKKHVKNQLSNIQLQNAYSSGLLQAQQSGSFYTDRSYNSLVSNKKKNQNSNNIMNSQSWEANNPKTKVLILNNGGKIINNKASLNNLHTTNLTIQNANQYNNISLNNTNSAYQIKSKLEHKSNTEILNNSKFPSSSNLQRLNTNNAANSNLNSINNTFVTSPYMKPENPDLEDLEDNVELNKFEILNKQLDVKEDLNNHSIFNPNAIIELTNTPSYRKTPDFKIQKDIVVDNPMHDFQKNFFDNIIRLQKELTTNKDLDNYNFTNLGNTYTKLNSFDLKFNNELGKVNKNYGKIDSKVRFANKNLYDKIIDEIPDFQTYKNLKMINEKTSHKFRLQPLQVSKKYPLDILANKIFSGLKNKDRYYDIDREWEEYLKKKDADNKFDDINPLYIS